MHPENIGRNPSFNPRAPAPALILLLAWTTLLVAPSGSKALAEDNGTQVMVVFNTNFDDSKALAEYYARRRKVPENQLLGLDLPKSESMTRQEFIDKLQKPLSQALHERKLFTYPAGTENGAGIQPTGASIRYLALCYGVPIRINKDPAWQEAGADQMQAELRRNEASVDSELACLAMGSHPITGPLANPFYGATNASLMHPTNGLLMVTRLDGPSPAIAQGLIDKAMEAETNGLWGRCYIDSRGITNGGYKLGDDWLRTAALIARRAGWETTLDERPETFGAGFPMSQIGMYAGWYDGAVSGPFTHPPVEFMPGAFAYHLHSFSAQTIRSTNANWVGPLLAAGATATMGCVDEPYLSGTPDIAMFFSRLFLGYSFGEAATASQGSLSWQTIAVGDPLYRPYALRPDLLHQELVRRGSPLVEWSNLRVVNLNLATGASLDEAIEHLTSLRDTRSSAVLAEKLGDLYLAKKRITDAIDVYAGAMKRGPSPQQRVRLLLTQAKLSAHYGRTRQAFTLYSQFLKEQLTYPDLPAIYTAVLPLAEELKETEMVERCKRELGAGK